jgi:hypothetical protein
VVLWLIGSWVLLLLWLGLWYWIMLLLAWGVRLVELWLVCGSGVLCDVCVG